MSSGRWLARRGSRPGDRCPCAGASPVDFERTPRGARFDQGMEMMPRKIVYWAHEKTSHTTRKTVAKRKIPRLVPSESSARDPPAIQAIATENDTAKSIVTTDTQARIRIVSR